MFGVPAYRGQVHHGHVLQMASLAGAVMSARGTVSLRGMLFPDSCFVQWSRNYMLYTALQDGADWLLMCDADTYTDDATNLIRMVRDADRSGAAVVAAPYKIRGGSGYAVARKPGGQLAREDFAGQLLEVDRIATGCMAVRCGWIREQWPEQPWFDARPTTGADGSPRMLGEDISFCDGVRQRAGTVLADGRFEPFHVGS